MDILLRAVKIIDKQSAFHLQLADILVLEGKINQIKPANTIQYQGQIFEKKNACVSLGWVDMHAYSFDPGFENKETLETFCKAAEAGGYTHVCLMPQADPVMQTKSQVEYVLAKTRHELVTILPVGAVSENLEGKDLAHIYDMQKAGAVAFSDGAQPSMSAGLLERALLYVKAFKGIILAHAEEKSLSKNGVMHEGITSTQLGLPAMPALAEEMIVNRDIYLVKHTQSSLHFLDISLKNSIYQIAKAKQEGLEITASVNAYNLVLTDTQIENYNTHFKLNPPLRPAEDVAALIAAIESGEIDTITSQHNPQDVDAKNVEFDKANFGAVGLESCFALANTILKNKISEEQLVDLFSTHARRILKLPKTSISEGAIADLTIFDTETNWIFSKENIFSKSKNSPFIGMPLVGKTWGVIHNQKIFLHA